MMRKSTLVLMIVICGLMFYTGCDDDDGGGQGEPTPTPTASPPPGGGVQPQACDNCPCNFFGVPMTEGCWVFEGQGPEFDTNTTPPGARCSVHPVDIGFSEGIAAFGAIEFGCAQGQFCCRIRAIGNENCAVDNVADQNLTIEQFSSCETCLEEYATALNDELDTGVSGGPPYECTRLQ